MEVNKKQIIYVAAISALILAGFFIIYDNISTQNKLRLPDSSDGISCISVYEYCLSYGKYRKDISDQSGIKYIIDILCQVEIDYTNPVKWEPEPGSTDITLVLHHENGTDRAMTMQFWDSDRIKFLPTSDNTVSMYWGTWPDVENFFWDLDYPATQLQKGLYQHP